MASPLFKINGGAPGADASVAASSTVTATLNSLDGVTSVEWSVAGTDDLGSPGSYTLTPSGFLGSTVSYTAGAAGTSILLKCRINAGVDPVTGNPSDTMQTTAVAYVLTVNGLRLKANGEDVAATVRDVAEVNAIARFQGTNVNASMRARLVATSNLALSGTGMTVDGKTVASGDIVLAAGQTDPTQNGPYTAASGAWARTSPATTAGAFPGLVIAIAEGTTYHDTIWVCTTDAPITLGVTALAFAESVFPTDINPTANTIALRDGSGNLRATAFDSGAAADLPIKRNGVTIFAVTATGIAFDAAITDPTLSASGASQNLRLKPGATGSLLLDTILVNVRDASGNSKLTVNVANTLLVTADSTVTSVTYSHSKRSGTGANAGATTVFSAQDGQNVAAGTNNNGGKLQLVGGAVGTGGTAGTNGPVEFKHGANVLGRFKYDADPRFQLDTGGVYFLFEANGTTQGLYFQTLGGSTQGVNFQSSLVIFADATPTETLRFAFNALGATTETIAVGVTSYRVVQTARASDAACGSIFFKPQAPFSTATTTNRDPGKFVIEFSDPTNGGTANPYLDIQQPAGTRWIACGKYAGGTAYGAYWAGQSITPSTNNFCFLGNGTTFSYLNVSTGGTISLSFAGVGTTGIDLDEATGAQFFKDAVPGADNTRNVGTDARRWARVRAVTVATGDLELIDEKKGAHWKVVENRDNLEVVNVRTGKRYELVLKEAA